MKYAWIENGVIRDLCAAHPSTLFTPAVAALYSVVVPSDAASGDAWNGTNLTKSVPFVPDPMPEVPEPTPKPVYNPVVQRVEEAAPVRNVEGVLEQQWAVVELFTDQDARDAAIAADLEAKRRAAAPKVSAIEYKMLFTSAERIAAKASVDPVIMDLQELLNDPRTLTVDLSLQSISDALDYMTAIGLLAAGRKAEILTGVVR